MMQTHTALTLILVCLPTLLAPATAGAQQPEVGVSYSYGRITNGDGVNLPAGFLVSFAGGGTESPWLVGEVGGNFRSDGGVRTKLFTVQGGVRFFSRTSEGLRPFAQFLAGFANLRGGGASVNKFSLEPAVGVDLPMAQGLDFRASLGLPIIVTEGENLKVLRVNLGVVFGGS